jgi:hypothetical protein
MRVGQDYQGAKSSGLVHAHVASANAVECDFWPYGLPWEPEFFLSAATGRPVTLSYS